MPAFNYKAITDSGARTKGVVEADSPEAARLMVAARGLIPTDVAPAGGAMNLEWLNKLQKRSGSVSASDLILFTKQFRTMFQAGLTIVNLLEVLEQQTESKKLKDVIISITSDIKGGSALHEAFRRHPSVFSPLYVSMIQSGEASGSLVEVLERLIYIVEHEFKVRKQIKAALTYPIVVVVMLTGAFFFLVTFVLPKFVAMFQKSGIALPFPTRVNIMIYEFLMAYWHLLILGVVGVVVGISMWVKTTQGRYALDMLLLRMPILGSVFRRGAMSRFASIFAILQSSGVSVLESIRIISGVIGNSVIAKEFDRLREKLEEGRGIAAPLRQSRWFTPMIINMIAIGEESGNLENMLREVATHYDYEVEYSIGRMTELITPVLTVGLAAVVGFFALSIFLPLFELMKTVK